MPLSHAAKARRKAAKTCAKKHLTGSVYRQQENAEAVAARIAGARAFACPCCGNWHVGKPQGGAS
jgi:hypothetical protein